MRSGTLGHAPPPGRRRSRYLGGHTHGRCTRRRVSQPGATHRFAKFTCDPRTTGSGCSEVTARPPQISLGMRFSGTRRLELIVPLRCPWTRKPTCGTPASLDRLKRLAGSAGGDPATVIGRLGPPRDRFSPRRSALFRKQPKME